jgi:hypothetical protein
MNLESNPLWTSLINLESEGISMNLKLIKENFNRGRMNIPEIYWLIKTVEQLIEENGAMAEKHADKDIAIAEFIQIIEQQDADIKLYQLQETIILERLKRNTLMMKEMKLNSRLTRFYEMSEENLKLAQENARLNELVRV